MSSESHDGTVVVEVTDGCIQFKFYDEILVFPFDPPKYQLDEISTKEEN